MTNLSNEDRALIARLEGCFRRDLTIGQAAAELGVPESTLRWRLQDKGLTVGRAVRLSLTGDLYATASNGSAPK